MCGAVIRWIRLAVEECLKWSHQRIVFGKPLINQPVIRSKLARMIALAESNQAWLEQITHQMNNMTYAQQSKLLSGPIALLKSHATRSAHEVADDATNIFGGRGLTRGGMGRVVEMFHRGYKFDAILGGTEEILADLGVRQAMGTYLGATPYLENRANKLAVCLKFPSRRKTLRWRPPPAIYYYRPSCTRSYSIANLPHRNKCPQPGCRSFRTAARSQDMAVKFNTRTHQGCSLIWDGTVYQAGHPATMELELNISQRTEMLDPESMLARMGLR